MLLKWNGSLIWVYQKRKVSQQLSLFLLPSNHIFLIYYRYNIDHQTPDSAATATAYLCGVKAQLGTIGVDGRTKRNDCPSSLEAHIDSILDWAQNQSISFLFDFLNIAAEFDNHHDYRKFRQKKLNTAILLFRIVLFSKTSVESK